MSRYKVPTITLIPDGHDCRLFLPIDELAGHLVGGCGRVQFYWTLYASGEAVETDRQILNFNNGVCVDRFDPVLQWNAESSGEFAQPRFLEMGFLALDEETSFTDHFPMSIYAMIAAGGRKSIFSDSAMKYSLPAVIAQVDAFGSFLDGYPIVRLDRNRDFGESFALINPYQKRIIGRLMASNGRKITRIRVEPLQATLVSLDEFLGCDNNWCGQVQLSATNRLIAFNVKHKLSDPSKINHIEHTDAFRGEPTHIPIFQIMRRRVGAILDRTKRAH